MNLFVLDYSPEKAAQYHCDRHVVKMILETAQMLSTVLRATGLESVRGTPLYKATHQNHPCTKWIAARPGNFGWAVELGCELLQEYTRRYDKIHKTTNLLVDIRTAFPHPAHPVDFALAMPEQFRDPADPVTSYRTYIAASKSHFARWAKTTPEPPWWQERRDYVIRNNLQIENDKNDGI